MPGTIQDILIEYGVPYAGADHKHGRLGWVQVDCPFCGTIGKFHLGISLSTGASACWRCGKHNTARVLAALTGKSAKQMRERVDGADTVEPPVRRTGRLVLPDGREPLQACHLAYLQQRGFAGADIARLWGVEGLRMPGGPWRHLRWRIFIPIHQHGEIVSWTTRSIRKGGQRYLSAGMDQEAVPHKSILYGADYARHAIIIHEGPIDVWATGPGAVATCGTAYTDAQVRAMARYPVRCVCFDSSDEAQERAQRLAAELAVFPGTTDNVQLETGKDAAEADPAEVAELRRAYL